MPQIDQLKKTKKRKTPPKLTKKTNLPVRAKTTKSQKIKHSPVEYYNCLLTQAQNDWLDPSTGKKQKIAACCKNCKINAPALNSQRNQELKKLITSYKQVGDSLSKLLKPLK